jgi:hypothetical protein
MRIALFLITLLGSTALMAQGFDDTVLTSPVPGGDGWSGFTDFSFLLKTLLTLSLAAVLGALIGYHPKFNQTADTLKEIEAPKVDIIYAVIGSLIGIMVVKYGLVIGFVLFGIGGLIRFRTVMRSANLTGQVILVTLIGLSCGLDLPHVAVLATAFGWGLMFLLEANVTYRIDVRALPNEQFSEAALAYRAALKNHGCRILGEKKNPDSGRARFIIRMTNGATREDIDQALHDNIDASLRGSVDWEID